MFVYELAGVGPRFISLFAFAHSHLELGQAFNIESRTEQAISVISTDIGCL